jgi:NADPH-dependent ferric siderophore reductase
MATTAPHQSMIDLAQESNSFVSMAEITGVRRISPAYVEISFSHARVHELAGIPGSHVLVRLEDADGTEVHRRYAVREVDPDTDELALWVCVDHEGAGARWADTAAPGDSVEMIGPFDSIAIDESADLHLFLGDMTSIATFYRFGELVRHPAKVAFILQVNSIDAAAAEAVRKGFQATAFFVERAGRRHSDPEGLLRGLAAYDLPRGRVHAYVVSESGCCQALREALLERGLSDDSISILPTWHDGIPNNNEGWPVGEAHVWAESSQAR